MPVRLRPVVHATPTGSGVHLRGWASSFTIEGGSGLWKVWERLAPQLSEGLPSLTVPAGTPPAVASAVELILDQLRAHDMLVTVPEDWGPDAPAPEIAGWLESVAADPLSTWRRLRAATFTITGDGLLAAAARRAFASAGLSVACGHGHLDRLEVGEGGHDGVLAGCGADVGYVLPPGLSLDVVDRLGVEGSPNEVLAALVGSAAVHRVICAVGGLPDPATEFVVHAGQTLPEASFPMVLVARLDPVRAGYHPWLSGIADPWQVLDALVDPELGPVETPVAGALPQVPANVAVSGEVLGVGTTAEAARLDAAMAALRADLPAGTVVGIDRSHALGSALRLAVSRLDGEPVPEREWACDPTARRWWKALTLRFAVPATVSVLRLAPGVVRAEIWADQLLAWAVEATAADAVAFAALAATGCVQAGGKGLAHLNGAAPVQVADEQPAWIGPEWLWPAGVRDREEALQASLAALPGVRVSEVPMRGVVAFAVEGP